MGPKRRALASSAVGVVLVGVVATGAVLFFAPEALSQKPSISWTRPPEGGSVASRSPADGPSDYSPPSASPSPSPTPRVTPTPSPQPSPSASKTGYIWQGETIWYLAGDGTVVPMPGVADLAPQMQGTRAIYVARSGNRFGLRAGTYAGEFKPNVVVAHPDGSRTQPGGVVLVAPVVARLLAEGLEGYQDVADKWLIALPVDIRTEPLADLVDVSFDTLGMQGFYDCSRVLVRFPGILPVVNVIPTNAGYHVLVEQLNVTAWQVINPARLDSPTGQIDPKQPMRDLILYGSDALELRRDVRVDHPVALGYPMLRAPGNVSVSLLVRDDHYEITPQRILSIDDVPVFVASAK